MDSGRDYSLRPEKKFGDIDKTTVGRILKRAERQGEEVEVRIAEIASKHPEAAEDLRKFIESLRITPPHNLGSYPFLLQTDPLRITTLWTGVFRAPWRSETWGQSGDRLPGSRLRVEAEERVDLLRELVSDGSFWEAFEEWETDLSSLVCASRLLV